MVDAKDLRPDDFVSLDGKFGDEVVDRVEPATRVWFVGWSHPVVYSEGRKLKVVNRGE